jgi:hypothetical protein
VRDRVGDEARRRGRDLLAHHQAVLAQRGPGGREVDDRLHQPRERRELDGALDLDDLGLAAGVLQPARRQARVLRRHAHDPQAPQRLGCRVRVAGDGGEHHRAAAVAEVEQLEDPALALLHEHVLAHDPEVGGPGLDVGGHVGGAHGHDADVAEEQPAVVRAHLGGVDADALERVERLDEQGAAGHREGEAEAVHRSSPASAACRRSTPMAKPTAGRSRPKRPSRSS